MKINGKNRNIFVGCYKDSLFYIDHRGTQKEVPMLAYMQTKILALLDVVCLVSHLLLLYSIVLHGFKNLYEY